MFFLALIPPELFEGLIFLSNNRNGTLCRHSLAAEDAFEWTTPIREPLDVPEMQPAFSWCHQYFAC